MIGFKPLVKKFPSVAKNTVVIGPAQLNNFPFEVFGSVQITCTGLDAGTFAVGATCPSDGVDRILQANPFDPTSPTLSGIVQGQIIVIPEEYIYQQLKITFANLGNAAAPVVHFSALGRKLRNQIGT